MRYHFVPVIIGGAVFLTSVPVVEERDHLHIEQRQYEEPSKLTHEPVVSTATVVTGTVGLFDHPGDKWNRNFL
jgi:hypothetical protein